MYSVPFLIFIPVAAGIVGKHPLSITRFEGIDDFYLEITKRGILDDVKLSSLNTDHKRNYCKRIFQSQFFRMKREVFFDTREPLALNKLQMYDVDLLEHVFEESPVLVAGTAGQLKVRFTESYPLRRRSVFIRRSRFYLMSKERAAVQYPVAFLFTENYKKDLQVLALVEPLIARAHSDLDKTTKYYQALRTYYPAIENETDDPLCALPKSSKLRICSVILNTQRYTEDSWFDFWPSKYNVNYECQTVELPTRILDYKVSAVQEVQPAEVGLEMQQTQEEVIIRERVFSCKCRHYFLNKSLLLYVMPNQYSTDESLFVIRYYDKRYMLDEYVSEVGAILGYGDEILSED